MKRKQIKSDSETMKLSTNPKFIAIIEDSRARMKAEGGISSEEMRRRLGLPRGKRRNEKEASAVERGFFVSTARRATAEDVKKVLLTGCGKTVF